MALQRIPAGASPALVVDALDRDGAVIVEGLLGVDLLERFNAELDPLLEQAKYAKHRPFINDATPLDVVRALPRESQALLGYAAHDALAAGGGHLGTVRMQDPAELLAAGEL